MFWKKKPADEEGKKEKLSGPREIPGPVQNYLVAEIKMDPDLVKLLRALVRMGETGEAPFNIRIFDNSEAQARQIEVKDYTSLDEHPELTIYEGWFDERSRQVKLAERKQVSWDTPLFSQAEVQQKIEALREPGELVFFYMASGLGHGGPLGMGAAVIELNPSYPGKNQKKYIINVADVIDMKPVGKGQKLFDSDKSKSIARWVKDGHHKRMY